MFKTSLVKFSLMRRFILILALAMASAVASSAQTDLSYKEWSDGPLRIEDFSTRKTSGDEMGKIYTGIQTYQGDWEKVSWNLRVKRLQSKAVFDSIRSWVRGDMLTDQAVRYGQLLFDQLFPDFQFPFKVHETVSDNSLTYITTTATWSFLKVAVFVYRDVS